MWKPWYKSKYSKLVERWGIEIPRLYKMGFPHNNCGGRCIAQGKREWKRLGHYFPERYNEVMNWEEKMRKELGTAKGKSILKDIGADKISSQRFCKTEHKEKLRLYKLLLVL